jgi:hypothetical protein
MSGAPAAGKPPLPDALAQDDVRPHPHAYPDEPADDPPASVTSGADPDSPGMGDDEPRAGDPPGTDDDEPRAEDPHEPGNEPESRPGGPAEVTEEIHDRPETTVREPEPGATSYPPTSYGPTEYGPPQDRSTDYGPPQDWSTDYGPPQDRSTDYGPPQDRSTDYRPSDYGPSPHPPGDEYGTGGVEVVPVKGGWDAVRRRHRRQTLTFLAAFLLVLGVGFVAWLTYSGVVPWPFGGKVNAAQSVCSRSKPLPPQQITLRVYNGSTRRGLAASVSAQLKAYGFNVQDTGNDPLEAKLRTAIELRHGDSGKLAVLTVRAYLAGKVRDVRDDRQADTVDVVLGPSFTHVHTRREANRALAALAPQLPMTCPAGVTPAPSASRSR